jgi:hypothetical protein
VQEAYESHRAMGYSKSVSMYSSSVKSHPADGRFPRPDKALIRHLERKWNPSGSNNPDVSSQHVNCAVIWARPTRTVLDVLQQIQARAAEYWGTGVSTLSTARSHLHRLSPNTTA